MLCKRGEAMNLFHLCFRVLQEQRRWTHLQPNICPTAPPSSLGRRKELSNPRPGRKWYCTERAQSGFTLHFGMFLTIHSLTQVHSEKQWETALHQPAHTALYWPENSSRCHKRGEVCVLASIDGLLKLENDRDKRFIFTL